MKTTIKTRSHGELEFFTGNGTRYVFVNFNGKPGTLGNQICNGGNMTGSTITYNGDDRDGFERLCRNWWKLYLRNERKCGY